MWKILFSGLILMYTIYSALPELCTSVTPINNHNVLFVTAHPDDEVMFFGPLLRYTLNPKWNNTVNLLCLSTGDADGQGEVRVKELGYAAYMVGLPPANVSVVDEPALQDSMDAQWDPSVVSEVVAKYAKEFDSSIFITFDDYGVSGHPNHIAVSKGVEKYANEAAVPGDELLVVQLQSVPIYRKYLFVIDAAFSRILDIMDGRGTVFSGQTDYHRVRQAMTSGHKSQMTWFRYLYVSFSRYMIANSFEYKLFPVKEAQPEATPAATAGHDDL